MPEEAADTSTEEQDSSPADEGTGENRIPQSRVSRMVKEAREEGRAELQTQISQMQDQLQELRDSRIRSEEQAKQTPAPQQKIYTRTELQTAVDAGTITQETAADISERQFETRVMANAERTIDERMSQAQESDAIERQITAYRTAIPDVLERNSESRARLTAEYQVLLGLKYPDNLQTELLALRSTFGPPERIRETTRDKRASSEEVGGGGGSTEGNSGSGASKVPAHLRAQYAKAISQGAYTGWDDPNIAAELKYVT